MKIFKLFPLACAALMMSACSSDDPSNGGSTGVNEPQYLSVNIVNVGATPSRATSEEYENGSADENKISKVRFYFFNGDGTPYLIKAPAEVDGVTTGNEEVNWLEATPGEDKTTSGTPSHVEKITNAVLVINGVQSAAPSAIVAVINPETLDPAVLENNGSMRLTQLRENAVGSTFYKTDASKGTVSDFVMSNSVFVNAGSDVCASLVAGHVATTADKAKANPVDLYVERVAAKVTADFDSKAFKTGDGTNWDATQYGTTTAVGKIGAYDVYAVIDGWGLADENGKAKVEKSVNTGWTNGILGINPWTTYDYRRCFWESSVEFNEGTNQPVNHKFNDFKANMGAELYTLPNTPDAQITNVYENNVTKFLVAATLKYKDEHENWHLAEICRYNGVMILGVENLKTQVALTFSKYYTSTGDSKYTQLTKDDITFAEPTTSMKNYQVTPTLVDDPAGKKEYYTKDSDGHFTQVGKDVVNAAIGENKAEIRTEGKAYYYVPIKHLGTTGNLGEYGVVRNHFYKINLTGLTGFGTPVYNPETVIDPTVPSYDNTYLAARIKVLQWRVVKQDVNIGK